MYDGELLLTRIKKQLIAEFDFSKNGFIEIDNFSYSKNDILAEIEREDFTDRLKYHIKIWEIKSILAFLERGQPSIYTAKQDFAKLPNDAVFLAFFSPYFSAPFDQVARNFLNEGRWEELSKLLDLHIYLQPEDREEAFRTIRIWLADNIRLFKNISKENYLHKRSQIEHWLEPGWDVFLNALPDEFYDTKCDIASCLINLSVYIQHTRRKDSRVISKGLMGMRSLPQRLRDIILKNDQAYRSNRIVPKNYRWAIWLAIILIKLLATGGCN
jgi:hypothetical protein